MFLSIKTKGTNADKLSYVLMKHPTKIFTKDNLTCFFPKYSQDECEAVISCKFPEYKLWKESNAYDIDGYVTDREYALSSLFLKELKTSFGTAINNSYAEDIVYLKNTIMYFEVKLLPFTTSLPIETIEQLFIECSYTDVVINQLSEDTEYLQNKFRVYSAEYKSTGTISDLFSKMMVLIPTIDNYIHFNPDAEILSNQFEKYGQGWVEKHPLQTLILNRFMRYKKKLVDKYFTNTTEKQETETSLEEKVNLGEHRLRWIEEQIKNLNVTSVVDCGCGSGRLLERLSPNKNLELYGVDCNPTSIIHAKRHNKKIQDNIWFSSLLYKDEKLLNKDCFVLQEVIEHMEEFQLNKSIDNIFNYYKPKYVLVTTPNISYNSVFGITGLRHRDHKFEFTDSEITNWAFSAQDKYPQYQVIEVPVSIGEGKEVAQKGVLDYPTFGVIFKRR